MVQAINTKILVAILAIVTAVGGAYLADRAKHQKQEAEFQQMYNQPLDKQTAQAINGFNSTGKRLQGSNIH